MSVTLDPWAESDSAPWLKVNTVLASLADYANGRPMESKSADYTFVLTDGGKCFYHPPADTTARTWTIPANASVAFPVGTELPMENDAGAGSLTVSITTDTLVHVGVAGTTGNFTIGPGDRALARKVSATRWRIGLVA